VLASDTGPVAARLAGRVGVALGAVAPCRMRCGATVSGWKQRSMMGLASFVH
jgi:hypothetical protein